MLELFALSAIECDAWFGVVVSSIVAGILIGNVIWDLVD